MWVIPKTNWKIHIENGEYLGDFFNIEDFNRLKNNLEHLKSLADSLYKEFLIIPIGEDRKYSDYLYADDINAIEDNLDTINEKTVNYPFGDKQTYSPNGVIMNTVELNRLEEAMLHLYELLTNQFNGRRTLVFNLGIKEGF